MFINGANFIALAVVMTFRLIFTGASYRKAWGLRQTGTREILQTEGNTRCGLYQKALSRRSRSVQSAVRNLAVGLAVQRLSS